MPKGAPKSLLSIAIGLFMSTPLAQSREILAAGKEIVREREKALMPKATKGKGKGGAKAAINAAVDAATASATGTAAAPKKSHKKKKGPTAVPAASAESGQSGQGTAPVAASEGSGDELSPEVAAIVNQG